MRFDEYIRRPVRARSPVRYYRQHKKVRLWWCDILAVQYIHLWPPETSFGFRVEWRRPLLDLFLPFGLTVAIGRHPVLTHPRFMHRHAGRGFLYAELPQDEAVL